MPVFRGDDTMPVGNQLRRFRRQHAAKQDPQDPTNS